MIIKGETKQFVKMIEGAQRKTLAVGEKGLLGEFHLAKGALLPVHSHPHEQIGYLISGEMVFTIQGREYPVKPGDSWAIPGGVEHSAKVTQDTVAIEVFVPVRQDYLD
mgnify:CR=1 FL=1